MVRLRHVLPCCLLLAISACAQAPAVTAAPGRASAKADPHAELIERARGVVSSYLQKMPNFICRQVVERCSVRPGYGCSSPGLSWQGDGRGYTKSGEAVSRFIDRIAATMVIENGVERYEDIVLNGAPVPAGLAATAGMWSTGEMVTLLSNVFAPFTQTRFTYRKDEKRSNVLAAVYDYEVDEVHSNWRIESGKRSMKPAYRGTVWLHKETAQVLRIEIRTAKLPRDFPVEKVEMAINYQFTLLGSQSFLLPADSRTVTCIKADYLWCRGNNVQFLNYRRFAAESTIKFDK